MKLINCSMGYHNGVSGLICRAQSPPSGYNCDCIMNILQVIIRCYFVCDSFRSQRMVSTFHYDNLYFAEVLENAEIGLFVAHITVSDQDAGKYGEVTCTLHSDFFQLQSLAPNQFKVLTNV